MQAGTRIGGFSPPEHDEIVLSNAQIVTRNEVIKGTLLLRDGEIRDIAPGQGIPDGALDLGGDYLLPGLVDVHTDHHEKQAIPRPGMLWNPLAAAVTHDLTLCGAGVTTVFDSLVVGAVGKPDRNRLLPLMVEALDSAARTGLFRSEHFLHLRCDATEPALFALLAPHLDAPNLRFVTVMDDSPARDPERYRRLYRYKGKSEEEIARALATAPSDLPTQNRRRLVEICRARGLPLGSHDDTTEAHIAEAAAFGLGIAEFPLTMVASHAAREAGLKIIVGSPNLVFGHSHVGNVSVRDLAREGLIDALCSDYIPASLLHAVWTLTSDPIAMSLPEAVALASSRPARIFGLADRGEIAPGLRADLIRVSVTLAGPVVRSVWVRGRWVL